MNARAPAGTLAIVRRGTETASVPGWTGDDAFDITGAVCSAATMPESRTLEQQPSAADPAISDVEQLLLGSEQARVALASQQQTGWTTSPAMLHA